MTAVEEAPVRAPATSRRRRGRPQRRRAGRRRHDSAVHRFFGRESWPLTLLCVGFPLWWVLGIAGLLPIALAVPMAGQLLKRPEVRIPRGFGLWLVFLVFVVLSVAMLWVDAPGAVPGGSGGSRLLVYGYRLLWYLACTIVLLWVGNLTEEQLPTRRVMRLLGWLFVVTALGGVLGVVMPRFQITSLVEMVTPRGLRSNSFVKSLIHPRAANESTFLGRSQFRPIAPFAFANSWGANFSMLLPFFLVSWLGRGARTWHRRVAPIVLVVSVVPIVYSLNRGLWISLGLGLLFIVVRLALSGRVMALGAAMLIVVVGAAVFLASPLASLTAERLENAHSNDRRGELLSLTVTSTIEGSPVLGYGSTRDVQGSFASIAGGATADCSACAVPPLGTQGHLWLVIFSQGLVGTVFFLGFFGLQLISHARVRTTVEAIGVCLLLFFAFQMFVYDTLGLPLFTLMIAIGLMWRTRVQRDRLGGAHTDRRTLESLLRWVRSGRRSIIALAVVGAMAGGALTMSKPPTFTARGAVLLTPSPVSLDPTSEEDSREVTIDTEAALILAEETIARVAAEVDQGDAGGSLRDRITVTAPPVTRVLNINVRDHDRRRAEETVSALVTTYLDVRTAYVVQRRDQTLASLQAQLDSLAGLDDDASLAGAGSETADETVTVQDLRAAIDELTQMPATAGEALRLDPARRLPAERPLYVLSGATLGALVALGALWLRRPRRRRRSG